MPEPTRAQLLGYAVAAVLVVALGARWIAGRGEAAAGSPVPAARPPVAGVRLETGARGRAVVHVAGSVRRPGVYRLADGARVEDAVRRAGGAARGADLGGVNLAARVADGQQVVVPRRVAAGASAPEGAVAAPAAAGATGAPVSLNSATLEQLDTLEGVGPATAQKILGWRRDHGGFGSVEDLGQVPGIGPKRLAALRDRVQP